MRDPSSEPHDVRGQALLEVLHALGCEVTECKSAQVDAKQEDGGLWIIRRGDQRADVFISEDRISLEAAVCACHALLIEPSAFFEHYYDMKIKGDI